MYDINFSVAVELYRDSKLLIRPVQHLRLVDRLQPFGNVSQIARFSGINERTTQTYFRFLQAQLLRTEGDLKSGLWIGFDIFLRGQINGRTGDCNFLPHCSWWEEITNSYQNETEITVHMDQWVSHCLL